MAHAQNPWGRVFQIQVKNLQLLLCSVPVTGREALCFRDVGMENRMLSQGTISSGGASQAASQSPVSSTHGDIQGCTAAQKREQEGEFESFSGGDEGSSREGDAHLQTLGTLAGPGSFRMHDSEQGKIILLTSSSFTVWWLSFFSRCFSCI